MMTVERQKTKYLTPVLKTAVLGFLDRRTECNCIMSYLKSLSSYPMPIENVIRSIKKHGCWLTEKDMRAHSIGYDIVIFNDNDILVCIDVAKEDLLLNVEVKTHPKTGINEVFVDGMKVGVFEQLNTDSPLCSFVSCCSHEKLTGDHYIAIGQALNLYNEAQGE